MWEKSSGTERDRRECVVRENEMQNGVRRGKFGVVDGDESA